MQRVTPVPLIALLWVFFSYLHQHLQERCTWVGQDFKTFPMLILCLRKRNNMEPNKSLIKLIVNISSSFPCKWINFVKRFRFFKSVVSSKHSSINFSLASRPLFSTFNKNDTNSFFLLLPDIILNQKCFLNISWKRKHC